MRRRFSSLLRLVGLPAWVVFVWMLIDMTETMFAVIKISTSGVRYLNDNPIYLAVFVVAWVALLLAWPDMRKFMPFLGKPTLGERAGKLEKDLEDLTFRVNAVSDALASNMAGDHMRLFHLQREITEIKQLLKIE